MRHATQLTKTLSSCPDWHYDVSFVSFKSREMITAAQAPAKSSRTIVWVLFIQRLKCQKWPNFVKIGFLTHKSKQNVFNFRVEGFWQTGNGLQFSFSLHYIMVLPVIISLFTPNQSLRACASISFKCKNWHWWFSWKTLMILIFWKLKITAFFLLTWQSVKLKSLVTLKENSNRFLNVD